MPVISLIIPCYNEEAVLEKMYDAIEKITVDLQRENYESEIVFVNDGSKDRTLQILRRLSAADQDVRYISFSRNFGKESAMLAGLENCTGDLCAIMDADLQHPPALLMDMVEKYEEGYEQVIAKRTRKGEKKVRTIFSKTYYKIVNKLMEIKLEDGVGDFRILSRKAIDSVIELKENNRFSKGLFAWIGYKQITVEYENLTRDDGESKWGLKSLFNYAIDGILSFNTKPLRTLIYVGVMITLISFLYIVYSFIEVLAYGVKTPGYFTLISAILLLGGIQLISIGVVGEYVGKIFYEVKRRPSYIIEEAVLKNMKEEKKVEK